MKKTKIKARRMWAPLAAKTIVATNRPILSEIEEPVFILPASKEAIEEMREVVAQELYESSPSIMVSPWDVAGLPAKNRWRRIAQTRVLAALGLTSPKQKK